MQSETRGMRYNDRIRRGGKRGIWIYKNILEWIAFLLVIGRTMSSNIEKHTDTYSSLMFQQKREFLI